MRACRPQANQENASNLCAKSNSDSKAGQDITKQKQNKKENAGNPHRTKRPAGNSRTNKNFCASVQNLNRALTRQKDKSSAEKVKVFIKITKYSKTRNIAKAQTDLNKPNKIPSGKDIMNKARQHQKNKSQIVHSNQISV